MEVPAELREQIEERAKELDWELMAVEMEKERDLDVACAYTVIKRKNPYAENGYDYATHIFYRVVSGFGLGRYDFKDFETALADMKSRL